MRDEIKMARIYLTEARRTKHRNWAFVLLRFAANCRLRAFIPAAPAKPKGQLNLFGDL
jgi:hypothetical protein